MRDIPKWDLHQHAVPDFYVEAMHRAGVVDVGGFGFPRWKPERSLRAMDALGTERAWLSVSAPGVCVPGIDSPAALARRLNDYGAGVVAGHPERFGWFATLPQIDIPAAIAEIERLDADAVVLMSSVDDVHFGHPDLDPLWSALDARRAVVYVHPNGRPGTAGAGLLNPLYLWQNDTAKTMLDFIRVGGHVRFPNIYWVLSHAGGPLPVVLDEALSGLRTIRPDIDTEFATWRSHVFLDAASKAYDEQLPAIIAFGGPGQVTFGSDFPWARRAAGAVIARAYASLTERLGLGDAEVAGIFRDNAARLFARQDRPAQRTTPGSLSDFPALTATATATTGAMPAAAPLPAGFWSGGEAAVRDRIRAYNDGLDSAGLAVIDILQPGFSSGEIDRCRRRGVINIRCPLDLGRFPGADEFIDQTLLDKLSQGADLLRFEPRETGGVPLLDDRRLDTVLFCAKGQWLRRLDRLEPSRITLAGTAGAIPYLARPIDLLHYLGRGRLGVLAYAWDNYVVRRPAGYRWLQSTRRE